MQYHVQHRNPKKKKYSLETQRKEIENILFQQSATKRITRKERIGTFTKKVENKRRNFHPRLKKYFNTFTAEGFSEPRPLMYLSKHIFWGQ